MPENNLREKIGRSKINSNDPLSAVLLVTEEGISIFAELFFFLVKYKRRRKVKYKKSNALKYTILSEVYEFYSR